MSAQPTQSIDAQVTGIGVAVRVHLDDTARSLRTMAAELETQAARLREAADRAQARGDLFDTHLATGQVIDLNLDRVTTNVTDVAFGTLNTVTLAARAEQAVSSVHRAKEGAHSIHDLLTALTAQRAQGSA